MDKRTEQIKAIIVEELGVSADKVKPEAKFIEDLGADPQKFLNLIMSLKHGLNIDIDVQNRELLQSVGDVIQLPNS